MKKIETATLRRTMPKSADSGCANGGDNAAPVTAYDIVETMQAMQNEAQRQVLTRFFKCDRGQYGYGDRFLGLKVPQTRAVVKAARGGVSLAEIQKLLYSEWHEVRLCALLLLVEEMNRALPHGNGAGDGGRRKEIADFYLRHARQANNWDLADLSCVGILGGFLLYPLPSGKMPSRAVLDRLSMSQNLWEQRIAIVSTLAFIRHGQFDDTLRIAERLLSHRHDLIHKAVGWMLREVGKRDMGVLEAFLEAHFAAMPRTTLRYAIERMADPRRIYWLRRK